MPGICLSRWQAGSEEAICSTSSFIATITHAWREVRICVLEDLGHRLLELEGRLGEDHATLEQEGSQLVDDGGSACDQSISYAVHGLKIKLVVCLNRNEAHVLAVDSFSDGFCIEKVVLVGLHERLHELSWDELHVMALLSQNPPKEVSPRTGFHPDQAGLHIGGEDDELLLSELLPQQHLACCAQGYEVKGSLAQVNANGTNLHVDDPP
jgi:hypothetical protein